MAQSLPEPSIRDIVFLHIPKTAGTSLRTALLSALPDAVKVFAYREPITGVRGRVVKIAQGDRPDPAQLLVLRARYARLRMFLGGHIVARDYIGAFHPASFVAFLRDPVERIISAYRHHVTHLNFSGSFADFYQQPQNINRQSRALWGLDLQRIGFLGITEALPDLAEALGRHIGVPITFATENVGTGARPDVDETARSRVAALNGEDVALYRHVKDNLALYTDFARRNRMSPMLARGLVSQQRPGLFRGWAIAAQPNQLVEIEVKIGQDTIQRVYADEYRKWKEGGSTARGRWSFTVRLPDQIANRPGVRFVFAGTDVNLQGSPTTGKSVRAD